MSKPKSKSSEEDSAKNSNLEQNNNGETNLQNGTNPTPQTVELPLNPDGTLNII